MKLFDQMRNKFNKVKEDSGLPIPIYSKMLNEIIKKTENIKDTHVEIANGLILITGKAEVGKMFIKKTIPFSITLQPVQMKDRELLFKIIEFKPVNMKFLNKRIFNKSPHLTYLDDHIKIDFNGWGVVQRIPVGAIKRYKIDEGKIIVTIGI
ncbi:hypothetical protein [Falsibacillus albus]|uniref:Uncharacterized protein n=1 Tax=Falsibacillus albus TaxID=2478915 RepID=A0A3L7JTX3_9BACI|nr:hypothetical protein [Falsibacillus albus]RLQ94303.1 hypothetical protein D9X91_14700 [Falsibacillus albus]